MRKVLAMRYDAPLKAGTRVALLGVRLVGKGQGHYAEYHEI